MITTNSLRDQKSALTRDRIMEALAEEILDRGAHELSVQGVADRAGVSHRTIYRYFPSKDELFHGYGQWIDDRLGEGAETMPSSLHGLAENAVEAFQKFEVEPHLMEAYVRIRAAGVRMEVQKRRSEAFQAVVSEGTGQLRPPYQRALAGVLRQVVTSETWARCREEFGADGESAGEAVAWVTQLIVDAVENGEVPDSWKREEE